jgi:hypothetical protein
MSPRYIRTTPDRKDQVAAAALSAALGVGVGLVAYYFVRLMLSREPLAGGNRGARRESSPEA